MLCSTVFVIAFLFWLWCSVESNSEHDVADMIANTVVMSLVFSVTVKC